jgi:hypothetical protein
MICVWQVFGDIRGFTFMAGIEDQRWKGKIEAPCSPPAAGRESSKCKEGIPFYCSSLANPVRLRRTTGNALAVAFSREK